MDSLRRKTTYENKSHFLFADFFSGSGVVLFEFFLRLFQSKKMNLNLKNWLMDAIEAQPEYQVIWQQNLSLVKEVLTDSSKTWNFVNQDAFCINNKKYDIILANPPFFSESRSLVSENLKKKTCHFMKEHEVKNLPNLFYSNLSDEGVFYFLAHQTSVDIFWKEEIKNGELKIAKNLRDAVILFGSRLNK